MHAKKERKEKWKGKRNRISWMRKWAIWGAENPKRHPDRKLPNNAKMGTPRKKKKKRFMRVHNKECLSFACAEE